MTGTAPSKHYNFDRNLAFAEDLALTVSDIIAFSGTDVILKVGPGYMEGVVVLDITVMDQTTTDEVYTFNLLGSNSATFASGIECLATLQVGHGAAATRVDIADVTSTIGRHCMFFSNERNKVIYDYVELSYVAAGTTPIMTVTAWIAPQSE